MKIFQKKSVLAYINAYKIRNRLHAKCIWSREADQTKST